MTSLAAKRDTPATVTTSRERYPVDTGADRIWPGAMVALAAGYAAPATAATGLLIVGRARAVEDVRLDGGGPVLPPGGPTAYGTQIPCVQCEEGRFGWAQTGTTITAEHVGSVVYAASDHEVTLDGTNRSPAGIVRQLDTLGNVFVESSLVLSATLTLAT